MDASAYAFTYGVRRTRDTLRLWQSRPLPVAGRWAAGSLAVAVAMLLAVLAVSTVDRHTVFLVSLGPPFVTGGPADLLAVLEHNALVLALHAMACVAGFIAGSSLPLQADAHRGVSRWVHEHGGRIAIAFVVAATGFSLTAQTWVLGHELGGVSGFLKVSPALLLVSVLPHALFELTALFLPLAAWIIASRRGEWEQLLAATLVTVTIAVPMLILAALIEVYVSPHLFATLTGIHPPITRTIGNVTVTVAGHGGQ
jgi:Stage II sporulation protein M